MWCHDVQDQHQQLLNKIEKQYQAIPIGATMTVILGIETSCDETAAAVVVDGHQVLANVVIAKLTSTPATEALSLKLLVAS